jgi:hypothetical protein
MEFSSSIAVEVVCFEGRHLADAPQMPRGLAVFGREKGLHQVPSDGRADRPATHAKDIHVIILNTLAGRKVVMNQRGASAGNFVRAHRCADAAAANGDAPFYLASHDGVRQWNNKVGVIIARN